MEKLLVLYIIEHVGLAHFKSFMEYSRHDTLDPSLVFVFNVLKR